MEQPGLALEQVNYAAQYLLPTQIYHEGSDQSDEHEQNEDNKDVNEKSNSEENNGRIESELFVQTYLDVVFDEDVYEGKCKIWHLAEKIIGTHYSVIQISLVIWNQIEAAIQKYLNEQKMPLEDRYKYVLDKINKAKKATRKGMVVFPYIRIKQADPTSTSAIKLLELLKLGADQLAFSDDELNNVWLSKIQTRTQNKARNREELRKKKKRKADEITLNETDLNVDKVNMNAVAGPPQKRQKKFSADYSFPPTEIREDSDSFLIIAQVPGLLRETLNVKFIEGTRQVIIEGTCALPQEIAFQWPHENLFMNTRPFTKTLTLDKNIIPAHSGILNLDSCPGYVFIKCTFNDISETHPQGLNENMNGLMHQGGVVNGADHVTVVLAQHEHIQIDTHNYVVITQLDGSEAEKQ